MILRLLKNIKQLGVHNEADFELVRCVKSTNFSALVCSSVTLINMFLFLYVGLVDEAFFAIIFSMLYCVPIVLNYWEKFNFSRYLLLSSFNFAIFFYCLKLGENSGVHYWYLTAIIVPFLLFKHSEVRKKLFFLLLVIGEIIYLNINQFRPSILLFRVNSLNISNVTLVSSFMIITAFVSLCSILFLIFNFLQNKIRKEIELNTHNGQILNALDSAAIVTYGDLTGKITYANENFVRISGYSLKELIGKNHSIVNSGQHPKEFFKEMWRNINSQMIWQGEICNKKKNGELYWVFSTIVPVLNKDGDTSYFISIRYDITELILIRARMEHSEKMATLGQMAGGLAHEINNPIGIIHGKAFQISRALKSQSTPDLEKLISDLAKISDNCQRISKIVKGLKVFSRNGENDPFLPVNLQTILADTLEICSDKLNAKKINFATSSVDVQINCREGQMVQVFTNLINNSIDAIEALEDRWIKIEVLNTNNKMIVRFIDSGNGIPKNIRDKIMNPFFTTKEVGKGTGLGLSISKGIIEDHGGKIYIDENAKNTTFVMEFQALAATA